MKEPVWDSSRLLLSEVLSTGAKQPKCECNYFHLDGTSVKNVGRPFAKDMLALCTNLEISFGICSSLLCQRVTSVSSF
jgi:hypothetical protein